MPAKEHPSRTSNSWECGRVSLNAENISENIDSELRLLCDITTASEKNEKSYEDTLRKKGFVDDTTCSQTDGDEPWTPFEKSLFEKGLEMFGRSRSVNVKLLFAIISNPVLVSSLTLYALFLNTISSVISS